MSQMLIRIEKKLHELTKSELTSLSSLLKLGSKRSKPDFHEAYLLVNEIWGANNVRIPIFRKLDNYDKERLAISYTSIQDFVTMHGSPKKLDVISNTKFMYYLAVSVTAARGLPLNFNSLLEISLTPQLLFEYAYPGYIDAGWARRVFESKPSSFLLSDERID